MQAVENLGLSFVYRLKMAVINPNEDYVFNAKLLLLMQIIAIRTTKARSAATARSYGYFALPIVNLGIFRSIAERANDIAPGEAIIAHILLPHLPYVLDCDCVLRRPSEWVYPFGSRVRVIGHLMLGRVKKDPVRLEVSSETRTVLRAIQPKRSPSCEG